MSTNNVVRASSDTSDEDIKSDDSDDDADEPSQQFFISRFHSSSETNIGHFPERGRSGGAFRDYEEQVWRMAFLVKGRADFVLVKITYAHSSWSSRLRIVFGSLISKLTQLTRGMSTSRAAVDSEDCNRNPSVLVTLKRILVYSWLNVLLVFVPVGILTYLTHAHPTVVFTSNALAIIPLSTLLSCGTENVALEMGDTIGALLNISFGNAVELLIL
jgi:hypothetical protein